MATYKLKIEKDGYKDVFELKTELEPDAIDVIIADIYHTLLKRATRQEAPDA